jgi:ribosomal protein L40E/rubrerythrin
VEDDRMSEAESGDEDALEDVPARVLAFDATIRAAVEKAPETSRWHRRFTSRFVKRKLDGEASDRTIRRAMKDAEALGWVEKKRPTATKWEPGPRAEEISGEAGADDLVDDEDDGGVDGDDVAWWCKYCETATVAGERPESCEGCGVEGSGLEPLGDVGGLLAAPSKVTVCTDCDAVWKGNATYCRECRSEAVRQANPRPQRAE